MAAGRRIRFTAVLIAVVFALTGFSSSGGSGSGGTSKGKSSGGGCSSSKSGKKKSYSGGSGRTASGSPSASPSGDPATAVVVTCTGASSAVTTLRVTSRLDRAATFAVRLYREGSGGTVVDTTDAEVTLEARATRTVDVALTDPARAAEVRTCRVGAVTVRSSSASATTGPAPTGSSDGSGGSSPRKPTKKSTSKPKSGAGASR
ncbi:hypothetical protein [Streptomyces subrutilus]|uniref:hypothetical protein n=1 Tax=Streptomyces subrutilus TaxID=36818 RepID=UPI0033D45978